VLFMIAGLKDFRPSIFGKANTFAQVAAIFFALLLLMEPVLWIKIALKFFLRATFFFTILSAVHYAFLVQLRLRDHGHAPEPATPAPKASTFRD
jgi:cardiolipin synthase (CMP-forming)